MHSVNKKSLVIYKIKYIKLVESIKSVSINLFWKIDILITQSLLDAVDHINSSVEYKNQKKICFNQSIN